MKKTVICTLLIGMFLLVGCGKQKAITYNNDISTSSNSNTTSSYENATNENDSEQATTYKLYEWAQSISNNYETQKQDINKKSVIGEQQIKGIPKIDLSNLTEIDSPDTVTCGITHSTSQALTAREEEMVFIKFDGLKENEKVRLYDIRGLLEIGYEGSYCPSNDSLAISLRVSDFKGTAHVLPDYIIQVTNGDSYYFLRVNDYFYVASK